MHTCASTDTQAGRTDDRVLCACMRTPIPPHAHSRARSARNKHNTYILNTHYYLSDTHSDRRYTIHSQHKCTHSPSAQMHEDHHRPSSSSSAASCCTILQHHMHTTQLHTTYYYATCLCSASWRAAIVGRYSVSNTRRRKPKTLCVLRVNCSSLCAPERVRRSCNVVDDD